MVRVPMVVVAERGGGHTQIDNLNAIIPVYFTLKAFIKTRENLAMP